MVARVIDNMCSKPCFTLHLSQYTAISHPLSIKLSQTTNLTDNNNPSYFANCPKEEVQVS
jgi:hypothetical protein